MQQAKKQVSRVRAASDLPCGVEAPPQDHTQYGDKRSTGPVTVSPPNGTNKVNSRTDPPSAQRPDQGQGIEMLF